MYVQVTLSSTEYGLERLKIEIIKKYNIYKETIEPKHRTKTTFDLKGLLVGRDIGRREIRQYLIDYFREAGTIDKILSMQFRT